jgi:branched-chain amino acid transport system ATP-binding protein
MTAVLEARGINKSFGAVTAADNLNIAIERDTVCGLIGSNGAGKTTFLNMVTGYLKPTSGTIHFENRDITALAPRQITRLGICRSFQIPQLSAAAHTGTAADAVEGMLERFGLGEYRDREAGLLPEGVRKLLDIAMAMVVRPKILLLDEPTSGVSADEKFKIMDMVMNAVRADGVTVLFVEHDMEIVSRYTHRILAFYEGRIIADGDPADVLNEAEVRKYVIGETVHIAHGGGNAPA